MGVFGTKSTAASKPAYPAKKPPAAKGGGKKTPAYLLKVKGPQDAKSEILTGLFEDTMGKPDTGAKFSGKDKEGNRFIVFINEDNSGSLSVVPSGSEEAVRLTGLFWNEGQQYGPYHSGKDKEGNRFFVSAYKKREA